MKQFALLAFVFSCLGAFAQVSSDYAVQLTATVQSSPPQITINIKPDAGATGYTVFKKLKDDNTWGASYDTLPGSATTFIDTAVTVGISYEYKFAKTGNVFGFGYINSGIEIPETEYRGKIILLVDSTYSDSLTLALTQLESDFRGDGWIVIRHDISPADSVTTIKQMIVADYNQDPFHVKAVFLFGHVPVPYSGDINPDGHPDHLGAWPADVYYGDMDGIWPDASVNDAGASDPRNRNIPGDGKFDNSSIPSDVDLEVGRVDMYNLPSFASSEMQLLANYLQRDHDYRNKVTTFQNRALIDDNFGAFSGEAFAASGWKNFGPQVDYSNVSELDYFSTLKTSDYVWSYGCGGGWYQGAGGVGSTIDFDTINVKTVFTMLFGSYFGDWDTQDNFLRSALASGALTNCWSGRPHWQVHHMGLGENIGYSTRLSQNNSNLYFYDYAARWVHIALMGDPTLRMYPIAPPSLFTATIVNNDAVMYWSASTDNVLGYNIYRTMDLSQPFMKVNGDIITGTTYVDSCVNIGHYYYMVRAVRLETTPSGSFYNQSQGVFSEVTQALDFTLTVNFYPTLNGDSMMITNNSTHVDNNLWIFGDGETSTDFAPVHVYAGNGSYNIQYIASNACYSDAVHFTMTITGISDIASNNGLIVYPNPFDNQFSISSPQFIVGEEKKLEVFDVEGRIIFSAPFSSSSYPVNTANWKPGVYLLKIQNGDKIALQRVVKM